MSRHSYHDDLGGAGAVMIGIAVLVLAIYLLVKLLNLLCRVFSKHPKNKALWIAVGCLLTTTTVGLLFQDTTATPVMLTLAGISFIGLIVTARIVELYYDDRFQQEGTLLTNVLRKPWWQGNSQLTQAA